MVNRHYFAVYFRTYALIAYIAVNVISEVNRSGAGWQVNNIISRSHNEYSVFEEIHLYRIQKIFPVSEALLPVPKLFNPKQFFFVFNALPAIHFFRSVF